MCEENNCFGQPKYFSSNHARYVYLNKTNSFPEYEPYDNFKFEVIMMCALPGSGKDTYIQKYGHLPMLSLDNIRRENNIDPADNKKNSLKIEIAKEEVKKFLRAKQSFIFNATNTTRSLRSKWLSIFNDYGAKVKIIYLEVPFQTLISQNKNRKYVVPENVIARMLNNLEIPSYDEAHDVEYIINSFRINENLEQNDRCLNR